MNIQKTFAKANIPLKFWLIVPISIIFAVALSAGYLTLAFTNKNLDNLIAAAEDAKNPSNLDIVVIKDPLCFDCFDIKPVIDAVKKQKVNITSERELELSSDEGKELIKKYAIKKIPTVIVSGEIDKDQALKDLFAKTGEIKDGVFVLTKIGNPYVSAENGEPRGRVYVILVEDKSCPQCFDPNIYINSFKTQLGMAIDSQENVDISTKEGKMVVNKNGITSVPSVVITGDIESFPILNQIGKINEEIFVLTKVNPPYKEIESGKVRGIVDATIISERSCTECFDANSFEQIFGNFGIKFREKTDQDIESADGKKTIEKYRIEQIPTIIMTGDVGAYENLTKLWSNIGTVENGSEYVLREGVKQLGAYKDLISGRIVQPATSN